MRNSEARAGEVVEAARKAKAGMTQERFAAELGISVDSYKRRKKGEIPFSLPELRRVKTALGPEVGPRVVGQILHDRAT
ncbi:hypothetical protein GCM10025865_00810 [Paraoerskovia sediminicola]|uniref:HTH cro/C1-type domain-containing protein n=1 Tax=Paraoerskovia sediminicola TaxID=1138587 RepID=A0ABM8FYG2_9CELL|nr:helix-turn-helix transcriptional regulator [Paraoerskovia sediminicola]BDZ40782.1 hypothetical protein GCM10025865_00810 [Paraoerskovia sediminicola]